jgi:ribosome recycling factor
MWERGLCRYKCRWPLVIRDKSTNDELLRVTSDQVTNDIRDKEIAMPLDDILMDCEMQMEKAVDHLQHELRGIRTGRASPALVEHVKVEYYGTPTDLRSIAAISIPEATQILIKPFNPSDLRLIEKAINDSKLNLTPHSDGKQLRLILPPMSQEVRLRMVGQCKKLSEDVKVQIRNARRDANKVIDTEQKGGILTEDDAEGGKEQVQELTKSYEEKVEAMLEHKRKDILEV